MSDSRIPFQEETWFRVLRFLEKNPKMSQRDLALGAGISTDRTPPVQKALVDKGLVNLDSFTANKDNHRHAYLLTPKGIATRAVMIRYFFKRKTPEDESLKAEVQALLYELKDNGAEAFGSNKKRQES